MGETRQLIETVARNILVWAPNLFDKLENQSLADESGLNIDIEDPPPDFLEWNGRIFRNSMECDNEYIPVSYVSTTDQ